MDEVGKLLPALFRKQVRRLEPRLLEILLPLWPRIAGKTMAQHSKPTCFASGVLTLATDGAAWGTALRHMTTEIRAEINGFLGQPVVKKLRINTVIQPDLFSFPSPPRRTALPAPLLGNQVMDTTSIADREIASALASSYAKYFDRPRR